MAGMIRDYLRQVWAELPPSMGKGERTRIVCEIEDHLMASWEAECERDMPEDETCRLILERFGSPLTLAQEFAYLDAQRKRQIVRSCLFAGLMAFLFMVLSSLFQYPEVSGTPIMLAINSLLCCGIVALYGWIGIHDTTFTASMETLGPWLGMKASLISGSLLAGTSLVSTLLISILWKVGGSGSLVSQQAMIGLTQTINACSTGAALLAWFGVTAWSSASAAYKTRSVGIGTKVGFWSGLMAGLVMALTGLLLYYVFLNVSLHTIWPHDPICKGSHDLAACEMNDLLGGMVTMVLLLPPIGTVLGVFAGFIGRESQLAAQYSSLQARTASLTLSGQESKIGFTVVFCGITFALFLLGIFTHLW
jgi:hypothetical protein